MTIKPADQQRLDAMVSEEKASYGGRRGDYFALLYLTRKLGVSVEEVANLVAFGGNDCGDHVTRTIMLAHGCLTERTFGMIDSRGT